MSKIRATRKPRKAVSKPALEEAMLLEMYRKMLLAREFDEKASDLYLKGLIPCGIHSSVGQEAVAAGCIPSMRRDDYMMASHRGHSASIAKGGDPRRMMAELFAKETGYCRGKGGSLHIMDYELGLAMCSIVGAQVPLSVGAGLSIQLMKTDQICICMFGDGASNQGAFHEGLNLAAIWKLPIVFICENNGFSVTMRTSRSTSVDDIAERARSYNIPGEIVDGMDAMAVHQVVSEFVTRARAGDGPSLVEAKTYRFHGHSRGDPPYGPYRTKEELASWREKDAIERLRKQLESWGMLSEVEDEKIRGQVAQAIDDAVKFAENSPFPGPETVLQDIYA
ncbi:MAG: thiamine pyrophosphate-dependent dehydrogenase E1 component subunit alpha [Candidatus Latescibacteria bacterium]|jgi:TPP-dependent pyruvate/acetoin dehydrogenase alpha subunit|nr:thiamine pyrophosphate-dependent dehydrogenase E1 component subunit alpha [Candidatus Latescibacterota bacterium]